MKLRILFVGICWNSLQDFFWIFSVKIFRVLLGSSEVRGIQTPLEGTGNPQAGASCHLATFLGNLQDPKKTLDLKTEHFMTSFICKKHRLLSPYSF